MSDDEIADEQIGESWVEEVDEDEIVFKDGLEDALPGWVKDLRSLVGASILGVALIDDPVGFVIAGVQRFLIDGLLTMAGEVGSIINEMWVLLTTQLVNALVMALDPFGRVGDIVIDALLLAGLQIESVAQVGGPVAPIAAVIVWAMVAYGSAIGLRAMLTVIKWI